MHLHAHLLTDAGMSIAASSGIVKCAHAQLQRPVSRGAWIIHPGQVRMSLVWDDVQPSEPLEMPSLPVGMHDWRCCVWPRRHLALRHHSAPTPACSTAPRLCDGESSARDQHHLLSCVPACVARKPLAAADRASALAGMRGGSPLPPPRRCEQTSHRLPLLIVKGNSTSQTFVCRELAPHLPANEARLRKQRRRRQVVCLLGRRRPGRRQPRCLRVPHLPRAGLEPPQVVFVLVAGDSALSRGSFL